MSVDYYEIDIDNVVATLTPQVLVNRCPQLGAYCDLVTSHPMARSHRCALCSRT